MPFRCFAARCCAATVGNKFAHAVPNGKADEKCGAKDQGKDWAAHVLASVLRSDPKKEPRRSGVNPGLWRLPGRPALTACSSRTASTPSCKSSIGKDHTRHSA